MNLRALRLDLRLLPLLALVGVVLMPTEAMGQAVPGFSKAFAPDSIAPGDTSTLTFTIDNTGTGGFMGNGSFTDTLPGGMTVAATPNFVNNCPGGLITANAGSGTITANFLEALPGTTCTITVDVTATATGVNLTGDLTSTFGNSGTATATLTVISVEAMDDSYSGAIQGNPFTVDAPGPLANDTGATSAIQASSTAFGTLDFSSNGSFTYTPDDDFSGTDSFTYRASDGINESDPATVTITVKACTFDVDMTDWTVPASGGTISTRITTNGQACVWTLDNNGLDWVTFEHDHLNGDGGASATVDPNFSISEGRAGTVIVAEKVLPVNQAAACHPQFVEDRVIAPARGGDMTFEVLAASDCAWVATAGVVDGDDDWLDLSDQTGMGPGTVTYTVAPFEGTVEGSGVARKSKHSIKPVGGVFSDRLFLLQQDEQRLDPPTRVRLDLKDSTADAPQRMRVAFTPIDDSAVRYTLRRKSKGYTSQFITTGTTSPMTDRDPPSDFESRRTCWRVLTRPAASVMAPLHSFFAETCWGHTALSYVTSADPASWTEEKGPARPIVRLYAAYRPWARSTVEFALEFADWELGYNLFIHPVTDLEKGVPDDTDIVIVPSASRGDLVGQVRHVNQANAELRRFARDGGSVLLHRWSDGERTYRAPVKGAPTARLGGYEEYRLGAGRFFITTLAVDHPDLELAHHLDELLARLVTEYEAEAR